MEDLIDRLRAAARESFFLKDLLSEAADALQDVQPVVHGKWEVYIKEKCLYRCSQCGLIIYSESAYDRREKQAYCSRCGAKMDGET